jgi:hypothetical protein
VARLLSTKISGASSPAAKALGIIVATISMANSAASDLFRNLLLFMISTLLILDSRPALFCRRVEVIYILLLLWAKP